MEVLCRRTLNLETRDVDGTEENELNVLVTSMCCYSVYT
jgi:hypothetical protein